MTIIAGIPVIAFAAALLVFSVTAFVRPDAAARFLRGFAQSFRAHVLEQSLRIVAGIGFVVYAPEMHLTSFFVLLGWILIITSAGLLLVPWRWHKKFADAVIPPVIAHTRLYGVCTAVLGLLVFYAILP